MCTEEKFFTISRESMGLDPLIKKEDPTNANHKIKNCSFRLKECQKFLDLPESQVKNAIKVKILKAVTISDTVYICIQSAIDVKNNDTLIEKIHDEDELTTNLAADILEVSTKNVRRLIEEGYLTVTGTFEFKYGHANLVKKGEVRKLKLQINEIKEFWKSQAKINRQLGAKKAVQTRKKISTDGSGFKEDFFKKAENLPYKEARLMKAGFSLLALNYYIDRKLSRNIVDKELVDLRNNALKKLTNVYKNTSNIKIYFVQGDNYVNYCSDCITNLNELKNNLNISWYEARHLGEQPCQKCKIDKDYFSVIVFFIQILDYTFILNSLYREIEDWFDFDTIPHKSASLLYLEEDKGLIGNAPMNKTDLKTFKIFEVINYLKDFIGSKDLDFSLNI